ncbi:50S ribosomal protein L25 [Peptoniphilus stercorisuis]|uniref:Large ribosomal subunit protein bL25 n=1 Tax=Peptoniphilus stercorisuis TaxID=1436965 RepID=A0ABS4KFS0_9FIRM|nr:50S ribosomal protein L25 [Peptoniphilus stercorisuis]MBP2025981.1 large subunit ribosomal protein L25 [Peptoniphilus stercorisuis]
MADTITLALTKREEVGKNKVDKLRQEGLVPGVVYSKGSEPYNVTVPQKDLVKIYELMGTSNIFEINVDGETSMVLFKDLQRHPFKNQILHFDLFLVDMSEKLKVTIPVVLEGKDDIKVQPSNLIQVIDEIEVECLPIDLPSEAMVNVSDMEIGDVKEVKDLDIANNDKIEIFIELDEAVATLQEVQEIEEEEVADVDAAAVPTVEETEEDAE